MAEEDKYGLWGWYDEEIALYDLAEAIWHINLVVKHWVSLTSAEKSDLENALGLIQSIIADRAVG